MPSLMSSTPSSPLHPSPALPRSTIAAQQPHPRSLQRSFTVPAKSANAAPSSASPGVEIGASAAIETLYVHPGAKVVQFNTASASRPSSSAGRKSSYGGGGLEATGGESGSLPWQNATERTMAAGPLEIYRVPGSVSFLHSGSLLHAILPRSQCWLVDGVSTFVFRIRSDNYYRLELPGQTAEDLELVEGLKETFAKVLYYERTSCPFQRGFGDELPEMPDRRRTLSRGGSVGPAKKWKFERRWRPEGMSGEEEHSDPQSSRPGSIYEGRGLTPEPGSGDEEAGEQHVRRSGIVVTPTKDRLAAPTRGMRSVTAPQLTLRTIPSKSKVPQIAGRINEAVRTQIESTATPPARRQSTVSRRQSQVVESMTPMLSPALESLDNVSTERPHKQNPKDEEGCKQATKGHKKEQEKVQEHVSDALENQTEGLLLHEPVEDLKTVQSPVVQTTLPQRDSHEILRETPQKISQEAAQETSRETPPEKSQQRSPDHPPEPQDQMTGVLLDSSSVETTTKSDAPFEDQSTAGASNEIDTAKAAELSQLLPSAAIEIPQQQTPRIAVTSDHPRFEPSHARHISSDCDYAQDSQMISTSSPSQSPSVSLHASPDPSISSADSWTSLPASTPPMAALAELRLRRGRSSNTLASSSSDVESYHSLDPTQSMESLDQQKQKQQRSLQPPRPQIRPRAPSTSALIAQTSALLVKRTASIFLGPPAHLVALMLRIAARIVAGGSPSDDGVSVNVETETEAVGLADVGFARPPREQVRGRSRKLGHRRVPGSFDFSDDEEEWGGM